MRNESFNADMRSVFQRLAAARAAAEARRPAPNAKPHAPQAASRQPRLEIAHVALRRSAREAHDAMT
jgi:hypothetical protein